VLEAAVQFMTAGDAAISTLYGIPHFYPKYGFATLGPEYTIAPTVLAEHAELPAGCTARDGAPGDLAALQRLYRDETASAYGSQVRTDDWWVWDELARALAPGAGEVRVVERGGRVVGYAWRASFCWWMEGMSQNAPPLRIGETFAADHDAAEAMLAACRLWAIEAGHDALELEIPPWSWVGTASRFQNTRVTELYGDEREFMGRSVGLLSLLQALAPELDARWRPISASTPSFAVTIVTFDERVTMAGDEAGIAVGANRPGDAELHLDPGTVARLVVGGFEPEVTLARHVIPASVASVLYELFPRHVPYIYPADRF
jgi:hypothetical protein